MLRHGGCRSADGSRRRLARRHELAGPRTAVVVGTTMGEAEILGGLQHNWIVHGLQSVRRSIIPRYGSTLLPIHVARAIGAQGMVLALPVRAPRETTRSGSRRT